MKAFVILYSATASLDYRFIAQPNDLAIHSSILNIFKKRIRGLLSSEMPIKEPKWMFCKEIYNEKSFILWGFACQNSTLSSKSIHDEKGRSIQCFIGMVIVSNDDQFRLPYDILAFKSIFNDIIDRNWKSFDSKPENLQIKVEDMSTSSYIYPGSGYSLNYSQNVCRFFSASRYSNEQLFSEAMSSRTSVSLATGVERKTEVMEPEYDPLMNAVLINTTGGIKDVSVRRICSKCKTPVSTLMDGLCQDCWNKQNVLRIPHKHVCKECGLETDCLSDDGLCQKCINKLNQTICLKCKRMVDTTEIDKKGKCRECHAKDTKIKRYYLLLALIILMVLCFLKCSVSKSQFDSPKWKDAHVFEWPFKANNNRVQFKKYVFLNSNSCSRIEKPIFHEKSFHCKIWKSRKFSRLTRNFSKINYLEAFTSAIWSKK